MGTENHVAQESKMDPLAKTFSDELNSVTSSPLPISMPKMETIKKAAMEAIKHFKIVVYTLEKFISSCQPQYKLPAFHVIDAIVRQSIYLHGDKDVYVARFSKHLTQTFEKAMIGSSHRDRQSLYKIVKKWKSKEVFSHSTLKPLFKIASKLYVIKSNNPNLDSKHKKPQAKCRETSTLKRNSDQQSVEVQTAGSERNSNIKEIFGTRPPSGETQPTETVLSPQMIRSNNINTNSATLINQTVTAAASIQDSILASSSAFGFNMRTTSSMIDISDRERRCLPPVRAGHLTVCSSTLWVGRLPKGVQVSDISDVFGMFGAITSINMVPAMGCVYVCMDRRQDAHKIISQREHIRLIKSRVNITWTPGEGFQKIAKFKDFWHADIGASYIPYIEIDESIDLDTLELGGVVDDETMTQAMRIKRQAKYRRNLEPSALRSNLIPPPFLLQNQTQQQILNPFVSAAYQGLLNPSRTALPGSLAAPLPSPIAAPVTNMQSQCQLAQLAPLIPFVNQNSAPQGISVAELQPLGSIHQAQETLSAEDMLISPYLNARSILQNQSNIPLNPNAQVSTASNVIPMEVLAFLRLAQPQGQTKPYP